MSTAKNEALGAWEAACLLGVHFSRPQAMAEKGLIDGKIIWASGDRKIRVYGRESIDRNLREYEADRRAGGVIGQPRQHLDRRQEMTRQLADRSRPRIAYDDAISVYQAAEILGVFPTRVPRIVAEGKIVGRVAQSGRAGNSRLWILSAESVERHAREIREAEEAGTKRGRPRIMRVYE